MLIYLRLIIVLFVNDKHSTNIYMLVSTCGINFCFHNHHLIFIVLSRE